MREPEILKAVLTAWTAVTNYSTLLPGGLHEFIAEQDNVPTEAKKWGIVRCEEGALARMTNGGPIREHIVSIDVYCADGSGMTANASLMDSLGTIPTVINQTLDNGGKIIDMWMHPGKGGQTDQTRRMVPVTMLTISWRVQSRWDY